MPGRCGIFAGSSALERVIQKVGSAEIERNGVETIVKF